MLKTPNWLSVVWLGVEDALRNCIKRVTFTG